MRRRELFKVAAGFGCTALGVFARSPNWLIAAPTITRLPTEEQIRSGRAENWELVDVINGHRREFGLPVVPLSPRLTVVAYLHSRDLGENEPHVKYGSLHSWSKDARWRGGAYVGSDSSTHSLMWDKPKKLTGYPAHGFEICASGAKDVRDALRLWTKSQAHHDVILNRGTWSADRWRWQALGAVFCKGYACAWFGNEKDGG